MMKSSQSPRTIPRKPLLRVVSIALAIWLCAMPQMMFSRDMLAFYAEMGTMPSPITEEEEVKHACTLSNASPVAGACPTEHDAREMPREDVRLHLALHGEVDSPPPKF